ncbi:tyrosine-type recombinase/integrase [Natrinema hispanicum]|uniref:Site-specific recombinase XerD n=1 Tax=Natrinema hispanicum TaxID=392421 RepID=A0A1I0FC74_9EURY|nr:tyrosine-type recombinase/integrase [Natrinema hispanicum]SET54799.1 Site-specific recombinase XerD [Natrinema hispanicum]
MNADDPEALDDRLPRQERLFEEADLPETDYETIDDYVLHRKANKDNEDHTLAGNLKHLRLASQRASVPLTKMGQTDFNRFIVEELDENRGLSDGTIDNYKSAIRPFFEWLGRPWYADIEFKEEDEDESGPDPEELLTQEEIDALLEQGDSRGKALVALYADTGWRASAIASLRMKHIDLRGDVAAVEVNEDAYVKSAEGHTPLSFSRAHIATYLQGEHPRRDDPEAALIHKKEGYEGEDGALCTSRIRTIIKEMGEEADIERERLNLHNFRHTAVTRWRRQGLPDRIIVKRAKWVEGTKMLERYDHPTEDEELEDMAVAMGLIERGNLDGTDIGEPGDDSRECPACFAVVRRGARYCPGCGNPLTADAAHDLPPEDIQDPEETAEDLADIEGVIDEMGTGVVLEQILQQNPDLLNKLDFD